VGNVDARLAHSLKDKVVGIPDLLEVGAERLGADEVPGLLDEVTEDRRCAGEYVVERGKVLLGRLDALVQPGEQRLLDAALKPRDRPRLELVDRLGELLGLRVERLPGG
jgi:hypothetical protein